MGSGGNFTAKLTDILETLGRTKMPSGACWLLGGSLQGWPVHLELRVEVKWLSPCTSGRCQLPLWPPWENELSGLEIV